MKRLTSIGLTEYVRTRRGSAPVPTPKYRATTGGLPLPQYMGIMRNLPQYQNR
jgi:hypothetical protein